MKYRIISQHSAFRSYYNVLSVRTYSWKGLRYLYFRKFLTSEFRPRFRILNGSTTRQAHADDVKLPKNSTKSSNSSTAMKLRDVLAFLWRSMAHSRRNRASSNVGRNFGEVRPPLQAGLAPKMADLDPKPKAPPPMIERSGTTTREIRAADAVDFKLHDELKRNKKITKRAELNLPELTQETQVGKISNGVYLYANRIPRIFSGLVSNFNLRKLVKLNNNNKPPSQTKVDVSKDKDASKDKATTAGIANIEIEPVVVPVPTPPKDPLPQTAEPLPTTAKLPWKRTQQAAWSSIEAGASRTRYLMRAMATSFNPASQATRISDFCKHLVENPQAKSLAVKERAIPLMLRLRALTGSEDTRAFINEALALLGYIRPLPGSGIRILSIDGGGTRGVMALEILRKFEEVTHQPVHRLFDFMCGVSTGAILSVLLGAMKASMDECEELYKQTSSEIFNQNTWLGTGKLVFNHAFYDTDAWVKVLQKNIGECPLIHTARDASCPKIAAVSTIVNEPRLRAFLFRNYEYPHRHQSQFPGSYTPQLWEAIRASAAAPGYFEEYKLGDFVHQDGGILTNNPSALAIHECRHLWPDEHIQCVISLGNGRYEPQVPANVSTSSLKTKLLKIVDSATDTEGVHMILNDLLPPKKYYRFNPYLTDAFSLDEIRPEKFKQLQTDAQMYIRKNEHKITEAAVQLMEQKSVMQRIRDSVKEKVMTYM